MRSLKWGRLILAAAALVCALTPPFSTDARAQVFSSVAKRFLSLASAPATCSEGQVYYNTTDDTQYNCTAANTWTAAGGGGSSLPAADTQTIVKGSVDATKLIRFEVDGLTAGATRVITVPDADITLARTNAAQTFTGVQTFGSSPTAPIGAATNEVWGGSATIGTGAGNVVIGNAANVSGTSAQSVVIGSSASVYASGVSNVVAIGSNASTNQNNSIQIGRYSGATSANQIIIGHAGANTELPTQMVIGSVTNAAPQANLHLTTTSGNGTNIAATNLKISPGRGTGTGAAGNLHIQTSPLLASGTTLQTLADRDVVVAAAKTLTESSATAIADIAVAAASVTGGTIYYTVEANDGTDYQSRRGSVNFTAVNKAGTLTTDIGTPAESVAVSAGTLTCTPTVTIGANKITLNLNAVSSLTQTVLRATYRIVLDGGTGTVTTL
jgi:hypothetical protein